MGVARESVVERTHVLVQHRMTLQGAFEFFELILGWQFAVDQQITDLEKIALLGQHLDRIAAITQNALLTI